MSGKIRVSLQNLIQKQIAHQICDQMKSPVWAQIWRGVRSQIPTQARDQMWSHLGDPMGVEMARWVAARGVAAREAVSYSRCQPARSSE